MEAERLAALEIQKEMERKRLENELKVKDVLKQQISELQEKEKEVISSLRTDKPISKPMACK